MSDLIHKIVGKIIEVGQSDTTKFRLGEIIRYSPSEILEILKQHESEIFGEESSTQTNTSNTLGALDCISRQAAINAMMALQAEDDEAYGCHIPEGFDGERAKEALEQLPSAQQWIPVSERLPEPRMAVLGYAPRYQNIYALYYDSAYGWMVWSPVRDDFFPNSQGEIIAWMPLPEPYKEVRDEYSN